MVILEHPTSLASELKSTTTENVLEYHGHLLMLMTLSIENDWVTSLGLTTKKVVQNILQWVHLRILLLLLLLLASRWILLLLLLLLAWWILSRRLTLKILVNLNIENLLHGSLDSFLLRIDILARRL
jgi:hypothetical protein